MHSKFYQTACDFLKRYGPYKEIKQSAPKHQTWRIIFATVKITFSVTDSQDLVSVGIPLHCYFHDH